MKGSKKSFIIQAAIWLVIMVSAIMLLPNTSQLIKDKGDTSLPSTVKSEVAQKIQDNWGCSYTKKMDYFYSVRKMKV